MTDPILELTDTKAEQLLELIYIAVAEYGDSADMTISEFAADVAMGMNETTTELTNSGRRSRKSQHEAT